MSASPLVAPSDQSGMLRDLNDRLTNLEQTAIVPVGLIAHCRGPVPNGWLLADGSTIDSARYGQLSAHLGGTTLPDIAGRVIVGKDAAGTFVTIGSTGGVETVTLTAAQSGMPTHTTGAGSAHAHTINGAANQIVNGSGGAGANVTTGGGGYAVKSLDNESAHTHPVTGVAASAGHTNLQPYIVLNAIIKV